MKCMPSFVDSLTFVYLYCKIHLVPFLILNTSLSLSLSRIFCHFYVNFDIEQKLREHIKCTSCNANTKKNTHTRYLIRATKISKNNSSHTKINNNDEETIGFWTIELTKQKFASMMIKVGRKIKCVHDFPECLTLEFCMFGGRNSFHIKWNWLYSNAHIIFIFSIYIRLKRIQMRIKRSVEN